MSYFSETLRLLVTSRGITQQELSRSSGVEQSIVSRISKGRAPTRPQVAALCAAISPESQERAALLVAHLRDEADEALKVAGLDSRHVLLDTCGEVGVVAEDAAAWGDHLPVLLRTELELLAQEALRSPEMREVISSWAAQIEAAAEERRKLGG